MLNQKNAAGKKKPTAFFFIANCKLHILLEQALPGHFGGLGQTHDLEHGRADVRQAAAFLQLTGIAHHAKGCRWLIGSFPVLNKTD